MIVSPRTWRHGRPADDDEAVQVRPHEQCLVVEHLLEVRHEPFAIDRVPGEAPTDVVVHPARGHGVERRRHDVPRGLGGGGHVGPQHQLEVERRRELRGLAEPTPLGVEGATQPLDRRVQVGHVGQLVGWLDRRGRVDRLGEGADVLAQLVRLVPEGVVDGGQQSQELGLWGSRYRRRTAGGRAS